MAAVLRQPNFATPWQVSRRGAEAEGMMGALARMAEAAGAPPTRLMRDFAGLALGPGRVSIADYERLALFDETHWAGADRRAVVGRRRGRELCLQANFRREWFALATNRIAAGAYLAAHGLPVVPTLAIYSRGLATPCATVLRTRDEIRQFLERRAGERIVGSPTEGGRPRFIERASLSEIDRLAAEVGEFQTAYLFQPWIAPHRDSAPLTGGALAAVNFLTATSAAGPRVIRAFWKLPGGLGAQLDLRTGQVLRVADLTGDDLGDGRAGRRGAGLVGARIPRWEAMKAAAVEGARLMGALPLLGWKVAPAEAGPVILSATPTPDLVRHQIVDRRGLLDADFLAFLDDQRRLAAEEAEQARAELAWD
jgi:hypothetical protein